MNIDELMNMLGKAFKGIEIDKFKPCLADDCEYQSDCSNKTFFEADQIIKNMKEVKSSTDDTDRYSYEVINLFEHLADGVSLESLNKKLNTYIPEKGLFLFEGGNKPIAVVFVSIDNKTNLIKNITLSRKKSQFNVNFFNEEVNVVDSEEDIPSTVTSYTPWKRYIIDSQKDTSAQSISDLHNDKNSNIYIWKKADKYFREWLNRNGYILLESEIFDDCIGYRCKRRNIEYTIFLFAYGQKRTSLLDGEYCEKFLEYPFAKNSIALVMYLNVKRYIDEDKIEYKVYSYSGEETIEPELWKITRVNDKTVLQYYPRKEIIEMVPKLIYAFNHNDADVYEYILSYDNPNPWFKSYTLSGYFMNDAVPSSLCSIREEYGDMKLGYVSFNDAIYSAVPYVEGYGYFAFSVDNKTDKIISITGYEFSGENNNVTDFIKTNIHEDDHLFDFVPNVIKVDVLSSVPSERFILKVTFDNGEVKKYILPIDEALENQSVVKYGKYDITDDIWSTAEISSGAPKDCWNRHEMKRGKAIKFINDLYIPTINCYLDGKDYYEPTICKEVVYEDDDYTLCKKWSWHVNCLREDEETGLYQGLLSGQAFNGYGISTFASSEGERLTSLEFDYMDSFSDGLALVSAENKGYGFINEELQLVIPMEYQYAEEFINGQALVKKDGVRYYIDKTGNKIENILYNNDAYSNVIKCSEDVYLVSTLDLEQMDLAYHSDHSSIAGNWGLVNEDDLEIVSPQYIYANPLKTGLIIVCKGQWTIDKKWDNEYNQGKYWSEEELWGVINTSGVEIVPCLYDDIIPFDDACTVFKVHSGGWKNGKWGVVDSNGKWLVEPTFEELGYEYKDGLFTFGDGNDLDDPIYGIYDMNQKKIIFEPQFSNVDLLEDGYINVNVFDKELERAVDKIIDLNGNEKFHSIYSAILCYRKPYEVIIDDGKGSRHGLIDENGKILLPCKYNTVWGEIYYDKKLMIYEEDDLQGIMDFDENVIVQPIYSKISGIYDPLLIVKSKEGYNYGIITQDGREVLPMIYSTIVWASNNRIICRQEGNCEVYELIEKK